MINDFTGIIFQYIFYYLAMVFMYIYYLLIRGRIHNINEIQRINFLVD